jgi:hypothetical protein
MWDAIDSNNIYYSNNVIIGSNNIPPDEDCVLTVYNSFQLIGNELPSFAIKKITHLGKC